MMRVRVTTNTIVTLLEAVQHLLSIHEAKGPCFDKLREAAAALGEETSRSLRRMSVLDALETPGERSERSEEDSDG